MAYPPTALTFTNIDSNESFDLKKFNDRFSDLKTYAESLKEGVDTKVDKVTNYGLSKNDFTDNYKSALDNLSTNYYNKTEIDDKNIYFPQFTYVVDSAEKLKDWADNKSGNDYTRVLVRGQISASNIHINLTNTGTKAIVGEKESKLTLSISNNGNIFEYTSPPFRTAFNTNPFESVNTGGDMSTTEPSVCVQSSDEFFISNLNIEVTFSSTTATQSVLCNCTNISNCKIVTNTTVTGKYAVSGCVGIYNSFFKLTKSGGSYNTTIYNCANLYNVLSINVQTGNSGRAWAFEFCYNMHGCIGIGKGDCNNPDEPATGFFGCRYLYGCYGVGQVRSNSSRYGCGFKNCYNVFHCRPLSHCHTAVFLNCYASHSPDSTYAVDDTANGGFNSMTNPD